MISLKGKGSLIWKAKFKKSNIQIKSHKNYNHVYQFIQSHVIIFSSARVQFLHYCFDFA